MDEENPEENPEELTPQEALLMNMMESHLHATITLGDFLHDLGILALKYMESLAELIPEEILEYRERARETTQHPSLEFPGEPTLSLVKDDADDPA
jgi:hypothetical protein